MNQSNFFKTLTHDFNVENCNKRIEELLYNNLLVTKNKANHAFELIKLYESQKVLTHLIYLRNKDESYLKLFKEQQGRFIKNIIRFYNVYYYFNNKHLDNEVVENKIKLFSNIDKEKSNIEKNLMKRYYTLINNLCKKINNENNLMENETGNHSYLLASNNYDIEERFYQKNKDIIKILLNEFFLIRQRNALNYGFSNYTEFQLYKIGRTCFFQEDNSQLREDACIALHDAFRSIKNHYKSVFKKNNYDARFQEIYLNNNLKEYYLNSNEIANVWENLSKLPDPIGNFARIMVTENLYHIQNNKKGKESFCFWIEKIKRPYICFNVYQGRIKISSIFHEFGHAYRLYSNRDNLEDLMPKLYGEVKEIFSIGMEFLCMQYFIDWGILNKEYKICFLCDSLNYLPYAFAIEEFQDYVYSSSYNMNEVDKNWSLISKKYEVFDNGDKDNIWLKEPGLVFSPYELGNYVLAQIYIFYYFVVYEKDFSNCYISICEKEPMMILNDLKQLLKVGSNTLPIINDYFVKQLN